MGNNHHSKYFLFFSFSSSFKAFNSLYLTFNNSTTNEERALQKFMRNAESLELHDVEAQTSPRHEASGKTSNFRNSFKALCFRFRHDDVDFGAQGITKRSFMLIVL